MSRNANSFAARTLSLLLGLSFVLPVNLTTPYAVRTTGVLYVAPAAQGSGDCSSWENACLLQTALANSVSGDEIWVMQGVHKPGVARTDTFTLKNGVALYGGFSGTETSLDERDWTAYITVLSGDIDGNDVNTDGNFIAETPADIQGANTYHVVTGGLTNNTAVLEGFFITGGLANHFNLGGDPLDYYGAGMYNKGSPLLANLIFSGNMAAGDGGGLWNVASPTLENVAFTHNAAAYGGGVFSSFGDPSLSHVTFTGNHAETRGGGMYNGSSSPALTNVTFSGNSSNGDGGGMINERGSPTLTNVTFSGNSAYDGGGMYNSINSNPTLTNLTFSDNSANTNGGGMSNNDNSNPTLTNVILWGNSASNGAGIYNNSSAPQISTSDIQGCGGSGGWNSACGVNGGGNIEADPLFVDAASGDLRLQDNSPAINAGNNATLPPGVLTDLDGAPRFVRVFVDLGAYENQTFPCPVGGVLYVDQDATGNQTGASWEDALTTLQDALQVTQACEIWVAEGMYYSDEGGSKADNDRSATFQLKSGVALYGGFAGSESSRDQRDWQANLTVLSGDIDQNDLTDSNGVVTDTANIQGANAYHVVTGSGMDETAVLDGFVITAGQANGSAESHNLGGGMYNVGGNSTLINVTFSGNSAELSGGGMFNNYDSSPTLTNVTFNDNIASNRGGGMINYSNPMLTKVTFSGNSSLYGGGMMNYGNPTLTNVTFNDNMAAHSGGGMATNNGDPTLTNVTFNGNSADNYGGGMYNYLSSSPILTNVTFSANSAAYGGGMNNDNSSPALTNVILWGNSAPNGPGIYNHSSTPQISYSDIQGCGGSGSWNSACGVDGGGNIEADPLFVDAANGNLRLQLNSPAIDAGNNVAVPTGITTDLDGSPRFVDIPTVPDTGNGTPPIVDMGAYEKDTTPPTVDSITRLDPNPTNAASIRFTVTFSEAVTGVDMADFSLYTNGGVTGASVTGVSGSGAVYTVTVSTGSGSGRLWLEVPALATIYDAADNQLNSAFTNGEVYDVDKTAPTISFITRLDPNPTNAASIRFTVTFSEAVTGVDMADFSLYTTGGVTGASVTGVSGSGTVYTVTVSTGTGGGTLRLDVPTTVTITDTVGNPLSGLPYADGQAYTILYNIFLPMIPKTTP